MSISHCSEQLTTIDVLTISQNGCLVSICTSNRIFFMYRVLFERWFWFSEFCVLWVNERAGQPLEFNLFGSKRRRRCFSKFLVDYDNESFCKWKHFFYSWFFKKTENPVLKEILSFWRKTPQAILFQIFLFTILIYTECFCKNILVFENDKKIHFL